jgi:hypothetical protein
VSVYNCREALVTENSTLAEISRAEAFWNDVPRGAMGGRLHVRSDDSRGAGSRRDVEDPDCAPRIARTSGPDCRMPYLRVATETQSDACQSRVWCRRVRRRQDWIVRVWLFARLPARMPLPPLRDALKTQATCPSFFPRVPVLGCFGATGRRATTEFLGKRRSTLNLASDPSLTI